MNYRVKFVPIAISCAVNGGHASLILLMVEVGAISDTYIDTLNHDQDAKETSHFSHYMPFW